jgi:hypothetical protein
MANFFRKLREKVVGLTSLEPINANRAMAFSLVRALFRRCVQENVGRRLAEKMRRGKKAGRTLRNRAHGRASWQAYRRRKQQEVNENGQYIDTLRGPPLPVRR